MVIALNAVAEGAAMVTENVFEARFMFVNELVRLGADVRTDGHHAVVRGVRAAVRRAGAGHRHPGRRRRWSLAGLVRRRRHARSSDVFHVDRGYPGFVEELRRLGADVTREPDPNAAFDRDRRRPVPAWRVRSREQPARLALVLAASTISRGPSVVVASRARMPAVSSRCRDSSPSTNVPGEATATSSP